MSKRIVCIIQARMGSTRLPGKVLLDIGGQPMLARVIRRAARSRRIDALMVATTVKPADDPVAEAARALGVPVSRGSEDDVLDRYHLAAKQAGADVIVRITSDCPLIDPTLIDQVIEVFTGASPMADYAANCLERSYPHGLDVEVASVSALDQAWREARNYQRVHVMPFLYENPQRFRLLAIRHEVDLSHLRWTVDTPEDLALVRALYDRLGNDDRFSWQEATALVAAEPALAGINAHIRQKSLAEG